MTSYASAMSQSTWTDLVDRAIDILKNHPRPDRYSFQSNETTIALLEMYRNSYSQRVNSVVNEIIEIHERINVS